ncbi:hypothetical protein Poli38472_005619 [Pythium oligandrum]|uniref:tRNA-intron lyase n=1 Tax=Pythium oligandrum TaxID=41045 RepID=A0A8K1FHQ6_PYTOL|nr:hypothetical protein Poli38472_005619 [Pythium oligandrum]|eukprot:TMW63001.1 hypothetical protein Poli38472_005619 [Pythium oligandrum]
MAFRHEHRLVGVLEDASGEHDDEVVLRLSIEEMALGVSEGFLRLKTKEGSGDDIHEESLLRAVTGTCVANENTGLDEATLLRIRVFADLWHRGYFVAFGSKFGADFLIYQGDPDSHHSIAMIMVKEWTASFGSVDIVSHCRMAKMVKKQITWASVHEGGVKYITLDHSLLVARQAN